MSKKNIILIATGLAIGVTAGYLFWFRKRGALTDYDREKLSNTKVVFDETVQEDLSIPVEDYNEQTSSGGYTQEELSEMDIIADYF